MKKIYKHYKYQHPETGKIYKSFRDSEKKDEPYVSDDGVKCPRLLDPGEGNNFQLGIIDKNAEVFQKDPDYVKKCSPKYVKFNDGHREKYDPTKHC